MDARRGRHCPAQGIVMEKLDPSEIPVRPLSRPASRRPGRAERAVWDSRSGGSGGGGGWPEGRERLPSAVLSRLRATRAHNDPRCPSLAGPAAFLRGKFLLNREGLRIYQPRRILATRILCVKRAYVGGSRSSLRSSPASNPPRPRQEAQRLKAGSLRVPGGG